MLSFGTSISTHILFSLFISICIVLEIGPRASHMLDRQSNTELHLSPLPFIIQTLSLQIFWGSSSYISVFDYYSNSTVL